MSEQSVDLTDLLFAILGVVLTWVLCLGWTPGDMILNNDHVFYYPLTQIFLDRGGDWEKLIYLPHMNGGASFIAMFGGVPVFHLGALLGLSVVTTLNISVFFIQSGIAFLGLKIVSPKSWLLKLATLWLVAFAPVVAWRLHAGHLNIIFALTSYLCLLWAVNCLLKNRTTFVQVLVCALCLMHSLLTNGQQLVVYSMIFGFPVAMAWLWQEKEGTWKEFFLSRRRTLSVLILTGLSAFLLSLPNFLGTLFYVLSGDGGRSLGGESVIYSFTPNSWIDWARSLPWSYTPLTEGPRNHLIFPHKWNYAFGPPLILTMFFLRKKPWLLAGVLLSGVFAILLAGNVFPVSNLLLKLFPILESFRVPERAVLIAVISLPIFFLRYVPSGNLERRQLVGLLALLVGGFFLPPPAQEAFAWIFSMVLVFSHLKGIKWLQNAAVLLIATFSVMAFQQRVGVLKITSERIETEFESVKLEKLPPEMKNPLFRVNLITLTNPFGANVVLPSGLSSLAGYFFVPRRFNQLVSALEEKPFSPALSGYMLGMRKEVFPIARYLYNICCQMRQKPPTSIHRYEDQPLGPGWFPSRIEWVKDFPDLATKMKAEPDGEQLIEKLWLVKSDEFFANGSSMQGGLSVNCSNSRLVKQVYDAENVKWENEVESEGRCPLVLATNYVSSFRAMDQNGNELEVFPANGALTGIVVPPGTSNITLSLHDRRPGWSYFGMALGFLILGFICWLSASCELRGS